MTLNGSISIINITPYNYWINNVSLGSTSLLDPNGVTIDEAVD